MVGKLSVLGLSVCVFGKGVISWVFLVKDNSQGKVSSVHLAANIFRSWGVDAPTRCVWGKRQHLL